MKTCSKCHQPKPLTEFYSDKSKPDGLGSRCKACVKAYNAQPEVKARIKAYGQQPEVKAERMAYQKDYRQQPEVKAYNMAYQKDYRQQPEVKAKKKAYGQQPEVKAERMAYQKDYRQQPEVKAKKKADDTRRVDQLSPSYVRKLLTQKTPLRAHQIPESLVKAKQQHLKLIRMICNLQKT